MESIRHFCGFAAALLAYSGTIHEVNGKPFIQVGLFQLPLL
jgi:hypothetical protein